MAGSVDAAKRAITSGFSEPGAGSLSEYVFERLAHHQRVGVDARPMLDSNDALVDEHRQPVDDDALAFRVGERSQRLKESLAIGVLADELVAATHDAIDGPHQRRRFAESIEVLDDGHLVGDGAIEPAKTHRLRPAYGVGEVV